MAEDTGGAIPKKGVQLSATVKPFVPRQNLQPPCENSPNVSGYFTGNTYYFPVIAVVGSPPWPPVPTSDMTNFRKNHSYMRHSMNVNNNNNIAPSAYYVTGNQHEEMHWESHRRNKQQRNIVYNAREQGENFDSQSRKQDRMKHNGSMNLNATKNLLSSNQYSNIPQYYDGRGISGVKIASRFSKPIEDFQSKLEDVCTWPALQHEQNTASSDVQLDHMNSAKSFASILKEVPSCKDGGINESKVTNEIEITKVETTTRTCPRVDEDLKGTGARAKQPKEKPNKRTSVKVQKDRSFVCDLQKVTIAKEELITEPEQKVVNKLISKEKGEKLHKQSKDEKPSTISNGEEVPNSGIKITNKSRRKTEGQIKQERRMVIKALPSTQGNVGFISEKLRDLIIGSNDQSGTAIKQSQNFSGVLSQDQFPDLGSRVRTKSANATEKESSLAKESVETEIKNLTVNSELKYEADFPSLISSSFKANALLLGKSTKNAEGKPDIGEEEKFPKKSDMVPSTSGLSRPKSMTVLRLGGKKPKVTSLIQFDIAHMLAKSKTKQNRKAVAKYMFKNPVRKTRKSVSVVANRLDSSAPKLRRGKVREIPIKKKPSTFKKIILRERGVKKLQRLMLQLQETKLLEESNDAEEAASSSNAEDGSASATAVTLPEPVISPAKALIHTRRFREYCDHLLSSNIDKVVTTLVQDLIRFHDRLYHKDPIKAKMRRRLVLGFREVMKHLKLKKLKCIILAPNLERIQSAGGVDDTANTIIQLANEQNLPIVFALGRKALGRICLKKVPVSCIGIFNYDGSETNYKKLMTLVTEARENYSKKLQEAEENVLKNEAEKHGDISTSGN